MKESLKPGIRSEFRFRVPLSKTVPALYPEAPEFQTMPEVFATGFLVGLVEWACVQALNPHIDWPKEQTLGTHVDLSHEAATPPGFEVTVRTELVEVVGRRLVFAVEADDGVDTVCRGRHERIVVDAERFAQRTERKRAAAQG